jgi:hypothetical protein
MGGCRTGTRVPQHLPPNTVVALFPIDFDTLIYFLLNPRHD